MELRSVGANIRNQDAQVEKRLLSLTLMNLEASKVDIEVLQEQRKLLEERLSMLYDLWISDKHHLEERLALNESMRRERELTHAFEIARMNLIHGSEQNEALLLKLRLEYALDDLELVQMRFEVLRLQHGEEKAKAQEHARYLENEEMTIKHQNAQRTLEMEQRAQSLQKALDVLEKNHCNEIAKLKSEHKRLSSATKHEVSALLKERDFVQDQLKQMENDYADRLRTKNEQLQVARENIEKLRLSVEEQQVANNERNLELTLLKFKMGEYESEIKLLKEDALKLTKENESLQELRYVLQKMKEKEDIRAKECEDFLRNGADGIETKKLLDQYTGQYQTCTHCQDVKTKPGTLKEGSSLMFEQGLQEMQSVKEYFEELKRKSKMLDVARLENDNLRMLYAELEAHVNNKKRPKKSITASKDQTCRNLADELEVAAVRPDLTQIHVNKLLLQMRPEAESNSMMYNADPVHDATENQNNRALKGNVGSHSAVTVLGKSSSAEKQDQRCIPQNKSRNSVEKPCPARINFFSSSFSVPKVKAVSSLSAIR